MMKMNKKSLRCLAALTAAIALVTGCTGRGSSRAAVRPSLAWAECPPDVESQYLSKHRCGWFTVPEDRSKPAGATVRMLVVQTWPVGKTPLPGFNASFGSDIGNFDTYGDKAAGATRTGHIGVTLELRGTGHSQPSLVCPEIDPLDARSAQARTGDQALQAAFLSAVKQCHNRLIGQGVNLASYDLQNAARDMDDLRVALGADRWAFMSTKGTSSRYLLEYLREFPNRVGGVWLDSPQFPQVDEVTEGIVGTTYGLDQLFTTCRSSRPCAAAYPDLRALWARALTRLERRPLTGEATAQHGPVVVDAGKLLRVARFALGGDGPENLTKLPAIIAAAARGQLDPDLEDLVANDPLYCAGYRPLCTGPGGNGFSHGVYLTVLCRDQAPFIDRAALTRNTRGDRALAAVFVQDPYLAACVAWSVPPADPVVHEAVRASVPQLMMSGRFDSFSPPPLTEKSAKAFEHAWALEIPGQTHNVLGFSDCPIFIRNAWIGNPAAPPAATSCLKDLRIVFS